MTQDQQFHAAFLALEPAFKQAIQAIGSGQHAVTTELMKINCATTLDGRSRDVGVHMFLCVDTSAALLRGVLAGIKEAGEIEAGNSASAPEPQVIA